MVIGIKPDVVSHAIANGISIRCSSDKGFDGAGRDEVEVVGEIGPAGIAAPGQFEFQDFIGAWQHDVEFGEVADARTAVGVGQPVAVELVGQFVDDAGDGEFHALQTGGLLMETGIGVGFGDEMRVEAGAMIGDVGIAEMVELGVDLQCTGCQIAAAVVIQQAKGDAARALAPSVTMACRFVTKWRASIQTQRAIWPGDGQYGFHILFGSLLDRLLDDFFRHGNPC